MAAISFEQSATPGLVSIVVPAYRASKFIGETLEAVGRQIYPHWEVLVVEDGAPDGTETIVRDFARQHPGHRVEYRCNGQNLRAAHTRNVAAALAAGEFVALLDADDRWTPDHLAVSIAAFGDSGKDIVYSTALMVEDQTELILGIWGPNPYELADFAQSFVARNLVPTSTAVMRRQVLADVGPWNTAFRCCEDYEFWLRCYAAGKQFQILGGCHCLYRKNHQGAVTQRWCSTWEESATITERFIRLPGSHLKTSYKYASASYELAARLHVQTDRAKDPSADRSRGPALFMKAWRLQPKKISYLAKAIRYGVAERLRRRRSPAPVAVTPTSAQETLARAAA
jgi:glycosyltransferase involved in cell wall biosynthesis